MHHPQFSSPCSRHAPGRERVFFGLGEGGAESTASTSQHSKRWPLHGHGHKRMCLTIGAGAPHPRAHGLGWACMKWGLRGGPPALTGLAGQGQCMSPSRQRGLALVSPFHAFSPRGGLDPAVDHAGNRPGVRLLREGLSTQGFHGFSKGACHPVPVSTPAPGLVFQTLGVGWALGSGAATFCSGGGGDGGRGCLHSQL